MRTLSSNQITCHLLIIISWHNNILTRARKSGLLLFIRNLQVSLPRQHQKHKKTRRHHSKIIWLITVHTSHLTFVVIVNYEINISPLTANFTLSTQLITRFTISEPMTFFCALPSTILENTSSLQTSHFTPRLIRSSR
jgi:hypothetical protein